MSTALDQIVRLNRIAYSWADSLFKIDNTQTVGFFKVDFKQKREHEKVPAATQDGVPIAMTDGMYELESLSWTVLATTWDVVTTRLAQKAGGKSYGDAEFTFTAQVSNPRIAVPVITHVISGCRVKDDSYTFENSQGKLVTVVTLDALYMRSNGKQLFTDKPGVI